MEIAISGATGFIGRRLTRYLTETGHNIYPLSRKLFVQQYSQNLQDIIEQVDVVINLAGTNVDRIWTRSNKEAILESRVITTRKIVQAINRAKSPKTLISASAVGYYPSVGCYDETSKVENYSFLSYVCRLWEREARRLNNTSRLIITRFGIVFSHNDGALHRMTSTKALGFLPRIGELEKPITWVDREDLIRAIEFMIQTEDIDGVVNVVAPHFTMQRDLLKAAKQRYKTLFVLPIPSLILRVLFGKASEIVTESPCVSSRKLSHAGFRFKSQNIYDFFNRY